MKQKKLVIYFITIAILLLAPLPILNMINFFSNGNIELKKLDKKYLFSTDKLESKINYLFYQHFKISLNKNQVIVGKDDFLFLGNGYAEILDKTKGTYKYNEKDIDNWTNKLKNIQNWYEDRGIKFAIVMAPNKHSVYKEKLPNWMLHNGKTITDDIVNFSNKKKINFLDLRTILKDKKNTQLYFTTDTHWNNKGSSIAYKETINYINDIYGLKYKTPRYHLVMNKRAGGDLSAFLKIRSMLANDHEKNYKYNFKYESEVCHGKITKEHELQKCSNKINPVMGINHDAQYIINKTARNKEKLLLICDSFATANSKLYNETFSTIWKFHYDHIYGSSLSEFVLNNKPEVVIYQIVERNLYNAKIVKAILSLPKIEHTNNGKKIFDINDIKYSYHKNNRLTIEKRKLTTTHRDPVIILNKLKTKSKFVKLYFDLESSMQTTFQYFYKKTKTSNYNESDSHKVVIKKGDNNISLLIPAKYINNELRVDLVSKVGTYKINDFSIYEVE